ncbi:RNA recognition motif domain-containing protein [Aliinostoc sp. HNIBRCY26]|uniref:RNA recognition motif domain-containing protein n=1 Tax=Aliinostoc sp. HNIBRCY26 TaxID=3418997 RepID=UPI003CFC3CAE
MLKVSNLPIPNTDSDLDKLFSRYGKIQIITLLREQESAYVILDNHEYEKDAIEKLNGSLWHKQEVKVEKVQDELLKEQSEETNPYDPPRGK